MIADTTTPERPFQPLSAWPVLLGWFALVVAIVWTFIRIAHAQEGHVVEGAVAGLAIPVALILLAGFFVVEPNMSRVLVLFGKYRGTVRKDGFWWTNPFTMKKRISLRAHNLDSDQIKVNDLLGNPIEISAVVVWRVHDTARACFDVEDYEEYVRVQSDAALRSLATSHPYDDGQADDVSTTLRGSTEEVAKELEEQLSSRLLQAGIEVQEARLNHLAYAQEIASAMLQRQQASAVVAARALIVEGAVGMVDMALEQLAQKGILELDGERRATLVGNLLVVLCGQASPTPVLNTGSLYN